MKSNTEIGSPPSGNKCRVQSDGVESLEYIRSTASFSVLQVLDLSFRVQREGEKEVIEK